MLALNDKLLRKNNIKNIDVTWVDALQQVKAFEKLIKKANWRPPQTTALNIKLDMENAMKAKWISKILKSEDCQKEIIDWADITETEKEDIRFMLKQNGFPVHLTPFQMPDTCDSKISKALRVDGKIAGWCIIHNAEPDTVQCSTIYVIEEYRNSIRTMNLIAQTGKDTFNKNIKYAIYQTSYKDRSLIKYLSMLTHEKGVAMKYHSLISRKYYTEPQDN